MSSNFYTPIINDVWNRLDEFGLRLQMPRIPGESNTAYRTRLINMTKSASNTSRQGILNAISAFLGLNSYNIEATLIFDLSYTPIRRDLSGTALPIEVSIDHQVIQLVDQDVWGETTGQASVIWNKEDGTYGTTLQIKEAVNGTLRIVYSTLQNGTLHVVKQSFEVTAAQSADDFNDARVEVLELHSPEFQQDYRALSGRIDESYFRLLEKLNQPFANTWGTFQWDNFFWHDGGYVNSVPLTYDAATLAPGTHYENGVGQGDDLKVVGIADDKTLLIQPGYFYIDGLEYYLFAHMLSQEFDPADHGGTLPDNLPLQFSETQPNGENYSQSINPVFGAPLVSVNDSRSTLQIGYSGDKIVYENDSRVKKVQKPVRPNGISRTYQYPIRLTTEEQVTGQTDGHTHNWTVNANLEDADNVNGITGRHSDGHYHNISNGVVEAAAAYSTNVLSTDTSQMDGTVGDPVAPGWTVNAPITQPDLEIKEGLEFDAKYQYLQVTDEQDYVILSTDASIAAKGRIAFECIVYGQDLEVILNSDSNGDVLVATIPPSFGQRHHVEFEYDAGFSIDRIIFGFGRAAGDALQNSSLSLSEVIIQSYSEHTHSISIPVNYGRAYPTIDRERKLVAELSAARISDENYTFILNTTDEGAKVTFSDNTQVHRLEYELEDGPYRLSGAVGPIMDGDTCKLSRCFLGIGNDKPIKADSDGNLSGFNIYPARSHFRTGEALGLSIELVDHEDGLIADAEITIAGAHEGSPTVLIAPMDRRVPANGQEKINFGHTYSDGTLYGRLVVVSTTLSEGESQVFDVSATIRTKEDWSGYPDAVLVTEDGNDRTYRWTKSITIIYDGALS